MAMSRSVVGWGVPVVRPVRGAHFVKRTRTCGLQSSWAWRQNTLAVERGGERRMCTYFMNHSEAVWMASNGSVVSRALVESGECRAKVVWHPEAARPAALRGAVGRSGAVHLWIAERHTSPKLVQQLEAARVPLPRGKVGGGDTVSSGCREQRPGAKVAQRLEAVRMAMHCRKMGWDVPLPVRHPK